MVYSLWLFIVFLFLLILHMSYETPHGQNPLGMVESIPEQEKNIKDYEYQIKLKNDRIKDLLKADQNHPKPEARNEIARDINQQKEQIKKFEDKINNEFTELIAVAEKRIEQLQGTNPSGDEKVKQQIDVLKFRLEKQKKERQKYERRQ